MLSPTTLVLVERKWRGLGGDLDHLAGVTGNRRTLELEDPHVLVAQPVDRCRQQ